MIPWRAEAARTHFQKKGWVDRSERQSYNPVFSVIQARYQPTRAYTPGLLTPPHLRMETIECLLFQSKLSSLPNSPACYTDDFPRSFFVLLHKWSAGVTLQWQALAVAPGSNPKICGDFTESWQIMAKWVKHFDQNTSFSPWILFVGQKYGQQSLP